MSLKLRKTFSGCLLLLLILSTGILNAQKRNALKPKAHLLKIIDKSLQQSSAQYHLLVKQLAPDRFPITFYSDKKQLATTGILIYRSYGAFWEMI